MQRVSDDADEAELQAYLNGVTIASEGVRDEILAGVFEVAVNISDVDVWQKNDLEIDTAGGEVLSHLMWRAEILGDLYPFEIDGVTLRYEPKETCLYEFFLATSLSKNLTEGEYTNFPRLFERVSGLIVRLYFGEHAKVVHIGSPRDGGISFKDVWQEINDASGEIVWCPEEGLPEGGPPKDEGSDIVIWFTAPDNRQIGQLFALGQCACGQNADSKFSDVAINRLSQWFHPFTAFEAVRFFTLPYLLVDPIIREASKQAGLTFDRARLVSVIKDGHDLPNDLLNSLQGTIDYYVSQI